MDLSFETNIEQWMRSMTAIERKQVPFATAKALTQTAIEVKGAHQALLPTIFDRPTRWTLNSLFVRPATKETLVSTVYFKDRSRARRHYLMPQVEGGPRPHKRFEVWLIRQGAMRPDEFAVPGKGLRLDAHGNIAGSVITQILSQLAASPDAMQWETSRSRKRAGASRARYFVPQQGSRLARGIWRRTGKGSIEPVLIFVGSTRYQARYRFHDISRKEAMARFPRNFAYAFEGAIRTAR